VKKIYWRPKRISRLAMIAMAVISVAGLAGVERFKTLKPRPYREEMLIAAQKAARAMDEIRQVRSEMGPIDASVDPIRSGLIGSAMTPVTSDSGFLAAKQTSINPNFAAVVVHWLKRAGVQRGDTVAVACSGSFPALNICVAAAMDAMGLRPIIISSASGSQWGANDPEFLWLDMERLLHERGLLGHRSVAASLGGQDDVGRGLSKEGVRALEQAIERNGLPRIASTGPEDSIARRMAVYRERAGNAPVRAFINVGGGTVSVGGPAGKRSFKAGLNLHRPSGGLPDSVMARFSGEGVPVIHLVRIEQLAQEYGLPRQPQTRPAPGEGGVYCEEQYNRLLAGGVLIVILAGLYLFVRSALGHRLLQAYTRGKDELYHEPMV